MTHPTVSQQVRQPACAQPAASGRRRRRRAFVLRAAAARGRSWRRPSERLRELTDVPPHLSHPIASPLTSPPPLPSLLPSQPHQPLARLLPPCFSFTAPHLHLPTPLPSPLIHSLPSPLIHSCTASPLSFTAAPPPLPSHSQPPTPHGRPLPSHSQVSCPRSLPMARLIEVIELFLDLPWPSMAFH